MTPLSRSPAPPDAYAESWNLFSRLLRDQADELNLPRSLLDECSSIPEPNSWTENRGFYAYRDDDFHLYVQSTKCLAIGGDKRVYEGHAFDLDVDETTTVLGSDPVVFLVPLEKGTWNEREFSLSAQCDSTHLVKTIAHAQFGIKKGRTGCAIQPRYTPLKDHLKASAAAINDLALSTLFQDYQKGLEALHTKQYVHKDIKADNLFVSDEDTGLVGDFGASAKYSEKGSPAIGMHFTSYSPPLLLEAEALYKARPDGASSVATIHALMERRGISSRGVSSPPLTGHDISEEILHFTPADDLYALGVTFEDLFKKPPFQGLESEFPITRHAISLAKGIAKEGK